MNLETAQSLSAKNVTADDIENAFADDRGRGEFIILTAEDGSFIQAAGEMDGPYVLEFRHESSETHITANDEVTKEEVKTAFLDFLRGGSSWRESHTWSELKTSSGCFGVLLFAIACSATLVALT